MNPTDTRPAPVTSDAPELLPLVRGEDGHVLTLRVEAEVRLPKIPASERQRLVERARDIAEQAVSREFRHWETTMRASAALR